MAERQFTVWCLLGEKAGDNTQVRALAEALSVGYEEKHIVAQPWELLCHLGSGVTLAGIDSSASSDLVAPWPDVVISAGRRNEPVARWIKQQSGGGSRLVHMGRPWAPLECWDLLVTTPQYFLPRQDNILHNSLPLYRINSDEMAFAGARLQRSLEHLPRPWIAVLVGGDSGRFVMTDKKAARLGRLAQALATASGGSLLVSDSARTSEAAGNALCEQILSPNYCYRVKDGGENPYRGILASADAFVVSGESMSMLGEAAATGNPLFIFDMDDIAPWWALAHSYRYKPLSHRFAMRFGARRMRRDIGNIQHALVESGRARWLDEAGLEKAAKVLRVSGQAAMPTSSASPAEEELQRAAEAVRQLVIEH
ncbi:MAG: nucleoside-diphosphate sugar epimerase [Halieaceae bacterium]|nr:nucleoside-diphosphate sugar epimerase [Halieaceae bacterium]